MCYLGLNIGWLWAANSAPVSEPSRTVLKSIFIGAAILLYVALAAFSAIRSDDHWLIATVAASAIAVVIGFGMIVLVSAFFYPGQFFHDAPLNQRLGSLAGTAAVVAIAAAVLAPAVGWISRYLSRAFA
jgi:hypothetical protein